MTKTKKSTLRAILLVLSVALIMAGCSSNLKNNPALEDSHPEATIQESASASSLPENQMEYQGEIYQRRENLTTVLFLGLDKFEHTEKKIGYTNNIQSDFLILAILDSNDNSCSLLHLNRDTMTPIRRLGIGGGPAGTFVGQLALAHTYGSGGSDSANNAVKAVSTLLGGVQIDHYITLTMNAVSVINDAIGGVTLTVLEDFGDIAPELKKGETVTLMGEESLLYVRMRAGIADQSNLNRMERQRQYLYAFYEKLMASSQADDSFLTKTLWKISDDFQSDCSTSVLDKLWKKISNAKLMPIRTIDGEAIKGTEYMEFYVDENSLQNTILDLFYEKIG